MNNQTTVLNCPVDIIAVEDVINKASCAIKNNQNFHIITINPEMIMCAQKDADFFNVLTNSDLNIPDGVGVRIALALKNVEGHRIRGIDCSRELIKHASENNLRLGFLGAKEEVIQKAHENFLKKYPNLNFVYIRNGYFQNDDEIINEVVSAKPQVMLVGLGSPKQEEIILKLKSKLSGCILIGVGGSFDVFSGIVKESPRVFQKLGLEWLYRTISQPERFKRIFPTLPLFLLKCIIDSIKPQKGIEN